MQSGGLREAGGHFRWEQAGSQEKGWWLVSVEGRGVLEVKGRGGRSCYKEDWPRTASDAQGRNESYVLVH